MNLLFVCTGNTCRSPMAEGMMRELAEREGLKIEVKSAGVAAYPGAPASRHTAAVLKDRGVSDLHSSQPVSEELMEWADLVLTMTGSHKNILCHQYPHAQNKIFTLKEFVGERDQDIIDPYGGSIEDYKETEKELDHLLKKLPSRLSQEQ